MTCTLARWSLPATGTGPAVTWPAIPAWPIGSPAPWAPPRGGSAMADEPAIEDYFVEDRTYPPPAGFTADALRRRCRDLRRGRGRLAGVLGPPGRRPRVVVRRVAHDPRLGPAVRQVVRRRHPQRVVQLPRPPRRGRPGRPGRVPLGGRARRHPHDHLRRPARRGAAVRQRAEGPGRRQGRPGRHLHADDPRAARGDARLRPHRRAHSVVFGGFSADSLSDRINDAECKVVVTADGGFRRGPPTCSSPSPTSRWPARPSVEHVVVVAGSPATTTPATCST